MYKFIFICCFYTTTLFAQTTPMGTSPKLNIVINEDVYNNYLCMLNNQHVLAVKNYSGKCSRREVVEIILIQQMLALGGFEYQFILEPDYYNMRERKLIEKGLLLISVDSVWQNEAKSMTDSVYISPPLIKKGEYQVGFYTAADNKKVLSTTTIEQLKDLSIISNKKWTVDWKSLSQANFTYLHHEKNWVTHAKLVSKHIIDMMLIPFSNDNDLTHMIRDIELTPIPNFVFPLTESRHVIIAKHHPLGEKTYQALLTGMKIMRDNGTITKAFTQSGLLNSKVKHWQRVN